MWNWIQSSELQCLAHLHSELGRGGGVATWCLSGRKAPGNGLCPGLKPPTLAGSHTLSQVQNPRLRSGGPHVLLQAQSGAGGRGVTFTLPRPHVLSVLELLLFVVVPLGQDVEQ